MILLVAFLIMMLKMVGIGPIVNKFKDSPFLTVVAWTYSYTIIALAVYAGTMLSK